MLKADEIFDGLAKNAIEFLLRALDQVESEPKYAIINFATGIELIFKARLALLGVEQIACNPINVDERKLAAGRLRTVGLELALERIEKVGDETIDRAISKALDKVVKHRNKVIHFHHPDLDVVAQREQVLKEMMVAWKQLFLLFNGRWRSLFTDYEESFGHIGLVLLSKVAFLSAVFDSVKNVPGALAFSTCPACGYKALDGQTGDRYRSEICRVCGYEAPSHKGIQQGDEQFVASCANCDGVETVVQTQFGFKCTECESVFSEAMSCGYCNADWVGVGEFFCDSASGCDHCGGPLSNIRDD